MPAWILPRSTAASIPDRFGQSYLQAILCTDFLAICQVYATVAGCYPCKRLFDVLRAFTVYMCILLTINAKLILDMFTGFIMASGYCIISGLLLYNVLTLYFDF